MNPNEKLTIDRSLVKLIVARDGRLFEPDRQGRLICVQGEGCLKPGQVLKLLAEGERLNSPGGANFEAARRLLESYRLLAEGRLDPFDTGSRQKSKRTPLAESQAGSLVARVDFVMDSFLDSPSPARADEGDLLYARFIKPEYESKAPEFYMALFKCSRATYFRMINQAIGSFSACLFGALPDAAEKEGFSL